jgi:hypothetical protein
MYLRRLQQLLSIASLVAPVIPALAGAPYVTGDPEPAEPGQSQLYFFPSGATTRDGWSGSAGADWSYGIAPDLHLTVVLPFAWDASDAGPAARGPGMIHDINAQVNWYTAPLLRH